MNAPFVPPYPPRGAGPVPVWRGFVGERARTAVYGWSELAFRQSYMKRRILGFNVHIPLDPDMVQRVLLDNAANYVKPDVVKRLLAPAIGEGLLTSDGGLWREQRRIVAANFAPAAVDALVPEFGSVGREAMERWRPGVRNMAVELDPGDDADHLQHPVQRRSPADPRLGHGAYRRGAGRGQRGPAAGDARPAADPLDAQRLEGPEGPEISALHARDGGARTAPGRRSGRFPRQAHPRPRRPLRAAPGAELAVDNAMTFYLAGHETTANAVTWTLYLLSEQPELQDRVAAESAGAVAAGEGPDLPDRLPLLRTVLEESLRLYPPAPRFDRQAVEPDRLGGEAVAARRHRLDLALDPPSPPGPVGATRTSSTPTASLPGGGTAATASSTSRSAPGRACASEPASPPPKRSPSSPTGWPAGASIRFPGTRCGSTEW